MYIRVELRVKKGECVKNLKDVRKVWEGIKSEKLSGISCGRCDNAATE